MDDVTGRRLAVVLGASGALGSGVAFALADRGWPLLLVARDIARARSATHAVQADAVAYDVLQRHPDDLVAAVIRTGADRLLVVDAIVDKRSARAMRKSLNGATSTTTRLCRRLATGGADLLLIGCGSTASVARFPYRTTYGRVKHRQAVTYLGLGLSAAVVYLPTLVGAGIGRPALVDRLLWPLADFAVHACSVEQAAASIAAFAENPGAAAQLDLPTEQRGLLALRQVTPSRTPRWLATVAAPLVAMLGHSILRNDPAWQRRASYSLLHLTPPRLRQTVDHHRLPPFVQASDGPVSQPAAGAQPPIMQSNR
jgi:NAD(P)-dependent dehydrogenase (short-subunit alcohol dehydrogenase family)